MAAPEIEERWRRNSNLLFETMQFLANRGEPVHKLEIEKHLRDVQPPTADEEIVRSTNGAQSWLNWFHWRTVAFSKVGWISKQRGNWSITDQGRQALARFTTPAALWSEADRLYGEAKPSQRVYLVRGSSVSGVNLVHDLWLAEGVCSYAAPLLRPLAANDAAGDVTTAVEEDYAESPFYLRKRKATELSTFLFKLAVGDVVVTTSDGKLYVGDVQSAWTQNVGEQRSTFQRSVEWRNPDSPIDYGDLEPALQNRLGTNNDIIDVTDEAARLTGTIDIQAANEPVAETRPPHEKLRYLTDDEARQLLVSKAWADELVELLNEKRQVVFYGPPGTGKTFLGQGVAELLVGAEQVRLVQFHPAYTYEDFFEGYRPAAGDGATIRFELRPGPLRNLAQRARAESDKAFVLIIDEINRANLAKVFGELYFLLEYREKSAELLYSDEPFELPTNLYIIGTMNTADRSIALVDGAMRRRFAFLPLDPGLADSPSATMLDLWLADNGLAKTAARLLKLLNDRINDDDLRIGPSYFMKSTDHGRQRIERIWRTSILPLLEEHHYGEWAAVRKRYDFADLWTDAGGDGGDV